MLKCSLALHQICLKFSSSACGKKIKIVAFVTHTQEIRRILRGIGWPVEIPQFDPPLNYAADDICQLLPNTPDGFPEIEADVHYDAGPDPPYKEDIDPPHYDEVHDCSHWQYNYDPPHGDNYYDPPHWEE